MFGIQDPMTIIAVIAILSPIATALINNGFQLWLKKIELKAELQRSVVYREIEILNDGLSALGLAFGANAPSHLKSSETAAKLLQCNPYLSTEVSKEQLMSICQTIQDAEAVNSGLYTDLVSELSKQLLARSTQVQSKPNKQDTKTV